MISILATLVLVFLLQLISYSWWWVIVVPLIIGFLEKDSMARASLGNGAGVFLLWFGMSLYQWANGGEIIVDRIVDVMGAGSGLTLALATGVIGFIPAAVAGYAGYSLRQSLLKEYQIS